jgi:hypothetical protein
MLSFEGCGQEQHFWKLAQFTCAASPHLRLSNFRQLRGNAPRLVFAQQLRRRAPTGLILEID